MDHHQTKQTKYVIQLAWVIFCPSCKGDQEVRESQVPRWRKKFYCGHCTMMFDDVDYRGHVIQCLKDEIAKKMKLATQSERPQKGPIVLVPVDGRS